MKEINKGQKLSIEKEISLKNFSISMKWENNNFEIDSSALLLSQSGKMEKEENFVFYNNNSSPCKSVILEDSAKGNYKKSFKVDLNKIPDDISRILFLLTIEGSTFGQVKNISSDITDNSGNSLINFNITDMTKETAIIALELYKHNNEWKIQATGNGFNSGLSAIIDQYGSEAVKVEETPSSQQQNSSTNSVSTPVNNPPSPAINNNFIPPAVIKKEMTAEDNQRLTLIRQINNNSNQKAQVVVALDLSYSMNMVLKNGVLEDTFDRLLPLAMQFDDDGSIDIFPFNDKAYNHPVPFTANNKDMYLSKEILFKYYLSEAYFTPVIQKIIEKYSNAGKSEPPVYVLFITDGDCKDEQQAEAAINQAQNKAIFWQFIGIGDKLSKFGFLNKLDTNNSKTIDNVNFLHIPQIDKMKDPDLYKGLLKEFPQWIQKVKGQGILK